MKIVVFSVSLYFLAASTLVDADNIRRVKASKSDDPSINRINMNQNEFGIGSSNGLIHDFQLAGTRKRGKSGKSSKNTKSSKSSKAGPPSPSVFRSVVSEFCDALIDCSAAITIDSSQALTSDLSCTGTITIDEGGSLDGNGLTISSDQSPAIIIKNGGKLTNVALSGTTSIGVRFDDDNGSLKNVKYEGTGAAVEVVDGSERIEINSLASTTATTLVSVSGGSGPVMIDQAQYTGDGTGVSIDESEQSVSIKGLHVSGADVGVTVAAADEVVVQNMVCENNEECIDVSNVQQLSISNSDILGTTVGNGVTFDSADGDLSLQNVLVKDAAVDGLNVVNAQNIILNSSKFLSNRGDGVVVDECTTIAVQDVFAGSNGGNGMDIACTDVTDDAIFQDIAVLDNGGTDLVANITMSSTTDEVNVENVVACDSGDDGSNGSITLNVPEDQLNADNIVADSCNLNGDGNCDTINVVTCEAFCDDPISFSDSSSSSSSSD